ncbi:MAG: cupin domain-containing protein [Treponema sp.]|jgi:mannose-6-phosphate isomerase-like protein (cupin superfamily)|nr:cupin domain-containing protein [Treponema sp.]
MVYRRDELKVESREHVRDGKGALSFVHYVEGKGAVQSNTSMFAEITLPPGTSIGYHPHHGETEFYIIIEGGGVVNDDGKEVPVGPGDVMVTGNGASHSIANNGEIPLKLTAAIIKG